MPIRATLLLIPYLIATLILIPLQAISVALGSRMAERIPVVYHRCVCWLFGARSNQPVSPGECVMAIAATIRAMAQRSRRSSSAWSFIACAASSGYAR